MKPFLERSEPLYRQIYKHIKRSIEVNELPTGARIRPSSELAKQFGAGLCTIQYALSALEKEGLIERKQRIGSFVKGQGVRLSDVGIFFGRDFWKMEGMEIYRILCGELQRLLEEERIGYHIFIDPALDGNEPRLHFPAGMLRMARSRQIQAVICPLSTLTATSAREELGLPMVNLNSDEPGGCNYDFHSMTALAARHLKEQGCSTIGLISSSFTTPDAYRQFHDAIRKEGLRTEARWIARPGEYVKDSMLEEYGYRKFLEMASSVPLPDGLMVFPDIAARGVVMGVLAKGIKVPGELKLVLHENKGVSLFKPFPAATIQADPCVAAKVALEQARAMVSGARPPSAILPLKLVLPENASWMNQI